MTFQDISDRVASWLSLKDRDASAAFLAVVTILLVGASFAIFGRGLTFSSIFVNDSFVFFDGIHRIAAGQVPHADFSTPVGALSYYLPYLGYRLVGGYAGAVEMASLLVALVVVPIAAILLWRRARPVIALLLLGVIAGIIIIPIVPGIRAPDYSHAMHYNRWGWGLLSALFLIALRPSGGGGPKANIMGLIGAILLFAMFFTKITYFVVGCAFVVLLLAYSDDRRRAGLIAALGTAVAIAAAYLAAPALVGGYIADIGQALDSDKAVRDSYLRVAIQNRQSLFIFGLALYAAVLKSDLRWQDYLIVAFVFGSGLAIIDQNFQFNFLVTLPVAFAILAGNGLGQKPAGRLANSVIAAGGFLMVLPFAEDWARTTLRYALAADPGAFATLEIDGLREMYVDNRVSFGAGEPPAIDVSDMDARTYLTSDLPLIWQTEREYLAALGEAADLVDRAGARGESIITLDFTNSVPLLVDAPRVSGGYSWIHIGRNVSEDNLPDGPEMFAGYEYVIVPLGALIPGIRNLYGAYLADNAVETGRSEHWLLLRLGTEAGPASG